MFYLFSKGHIGSTCKRDCDGANYLRIKAWLKLRTEKGGSIPAQTGLRLYLNPSSPSCLFKMKLIVSGHILEVDTNLARPLTAVKALCIDISTATADRCTHFLQDI